MANTAANSPACCPDRQVLLAFHQGSLSAPEIECVGSHLETCESCLVFLDGQNTNAASQESAKSLLLDDTAIERIRSDPKFQEMVAHVKQIDLPVFTETTPWPPPSDPLAKQPADDVPERIGRYFVIKPLGRGGFANVYLASDAEQQRQVAIKVPRGDRRTSPRRIDEFLQEARTTATLSHPNILPVYDFDRLPGGSCYVVMKYIEGQSLDKAIASERFGFERVAEICIQIAEALDYAHDKRFIHRDIKPANILLDAQGVVCVADFGLAIHEDAQHAHKDEFAGTCAYMSPEQIGPGTSHYFDHRTDIWSLGVVMYELLTRETPFAGKSDSVRIDKILNQPIRTPRSIDRNVPEELERICLSCLERQVEDRCPSARELADRLRNWQAARQRGKQRWPAKLAKLAFAAAAFLTAIALLYLAVTTNSVGSLFRGDDASIVTKWLEKKPENIVGDLGGRAVFDSERKQYSVGPTTSRWVARFQQVQSDTIHLHADLSVKDWVGTGGFAWQIVEPGEQQLQNYRWFTAEFYRSSRGKTCSLVVREIHLDQFGIVVDNSALARVEVPVPREKSSALNIVIQERTLTIQFDGNPALEVTTPVKDVQSWTGNGTLILALTGNGERTILSHVSVGTMRKKAPREK